MREFTRALADLSRACALAPTNAEYHFQRGEVYWQDGQPRPALKDFDAAIKLRPEDSRAHLDRAAILLSQYDAGRKALKRKIESDLAAVSRLAQPGSDVRLSIDSIYDRIGDYSAAIDQDHEWLVHHPLENDQAQGLNSLCWIRATADRNLHQALSECDRALNIMPFDTPYTGSYVDDLPRRDPDILDSRGLVYLRLGRLADAIDDYDSALRKNPKIATSLYGRGLAELRQGEKTQGQSDLAAAKKIDPNIGKRFARMGLKP